MYDNFGGGGGGVERMYRNRAHDAFNQPGYYNVVHNLNSHNNYLKISGHSSFNIKYSNIIEITVPKSYS